MAYSKDSYVFTDRRKCFVNQDTPKCNGRYVHSLSVIPFGAIAGLHMHIDLNDFAASSSQ